MFDIEHPSDKERFNLGNMSKKVRRQGIEGHIRLLHKHTAKIYRGKSLHESINI